MSRKLTRRMFLEQLGGATAVVLGAGGLPSLAGALVGAAETEPTLESPLLLDSPTNGDEDAYPNKIASYTKGLPHDERGEVDLAAYAAFVKALDSRTYAAFEAVPLGGQTKFANPLAAYALELEGSDPLQYAMPAPPAFASAETASEMVELYWQALTRDVPFAEYGTHALTNTAIADLNKCSDFRGPKGNGVVTLDTLFRGNTPGDLTGSYLLSMAYPEGCPTHPAYPAGHAAIAGACVTVLKAFFNESFVIVSPVMASADGLSLVPYKGTALTVGGELNKLAANIALGRNAAGVHWRSDSSEGLKLGEAVAVRILRDLRTTCPEQFSGFSFTKFDGSSVTV